MPLCDCSYIQTDALVLSVRCRAIAAAAAVAATFFLMLLLLPRNDIIGKEQGAVEMAARMRRLTRVQRVCTDKGTQIGISCMGMLRVAIGTSSCGSS